MFEMFWLSQIEGQGLRWVQLWTTFTCCTLIQKTANSWPSLKVLHCVKHCIYTFSVPDECTLLQLSSLSDISTYKTGHCGFWVVRKSIRRLHFNIFLSLCATPQLFVNPTLTQEKFLRFAVNRWLSMFCCQDYLGWPASDGFLSKLVRGLLLILMFALCFPRKEK